MKKKMKQAICSAFEPPKPKRKEAFISSITMPPSNFMEFLFSQIGYIRKRVWVLQFVVVGLCILGLIIVKHELALHQLSIISSIVPLVALMTVTELSRSFSHNMNELEMTTRYHLNQVLIARMTVLGITNLICVTMILAFLSFQMHANFLRLSLYLFVPYLLTCFGSLLILNKIRNSNTNFYCGCMCGVVIGANVLLTQMKQGMYENSYLFYWIIIFCFITIGIIAQAKKLIKITEELQWNSMLIG